MVSFGYVLPTRGVVLSSDDAPTLTAKAQSDVLGMARRVEALGFDSVWVGDSVLAKPRLEALSTLAAVAGATDSVTLGTAVYLPTLRHAVHVAHQTATIDQLSGGRLVLGLGVGRGTDAELEQANLDVEYGRRGTRLDETLDVVTALWSGSERDYEGSVFDLVDASIGFQPARPPPIYVATVGYDPEQGFPRPIRDRTIEHGDGWIPISLSPASYAAGLESIRADLEEAGRDPAAFDAALYLDVVIADSETAAIQTTRRFLEAYYPAWGDLSDDFIRARGAFGRPEAVRETIEAYDEAGVDTIAVRFTSSEQRDQLARFVDAIDR